MSVKQRERARAILDLIRHADPEDIDWRREIDQHGDLLEDIASDMLDRADDLLRFEASPIPENQVLEEVATMMMLVWVEHSIRVRDQLALARRDRRDHPQAQFLGRDRCEP